MKVALVHDWLSVLGGAEQTLLSMSEIFPQAPIFTSVFNRRKIPQFKDIQVITSFIDKLPYGQEKPQFYLPLLPKIFENFDLKDFDLVISNCHAVCKGVVTKPKTPHISYCHTPTRYIWLPWLDSRLNDSWLKKIIAHRLRLWDFQAAQKVDKFVANSQTTAQRIKKYYRRDADIIYPPVRTSYYKPLDSLNKLGNYYLLVGRLVAYKKPNLVVEAFNQLGLPLKIIGAGPEFERLKKTAKKNIEFLGRLSDEEIKKYYSRALAFIFPAEEDFGIVLVEAMAAGRPVIAFGRGGATETVLAGITGEFFGEQSAESLVAAVKNFDPLKYEPQKIRRRAEEFDEKVFKKKFLEYTKKQAR